MFITGLVVLALVALSCGESGMSFEEIDQALAESLNEIKTLSEDVPVWPENYSDMFGQPEDYETTSSEPHVTKEHVGSSTVWKVVLVLAVLLLAVLGVLSTVYYLCVWRGGRMHYEQQKDVST